MEKIFIYTCITGGYDSLMQPLLPAEGFEFICFVQKGAGLGERVGAWKIEELPFGWNDPVLLSRCPKMNPQTVLPEDSAWSLWIDGNIGIIGAGIYELCRKLQADDVKYAGIRHPFSDCAYVECERCLKNRRESLWNLLRTVHFLRGKGYPEHAGMMENNVIFRKHNDPAVVEFDQWWWECFVNYAHRDQLTHGFALADTPSLKTTLLFPEGISARNHPDLIYVKHPAEPLTWLQRKIKYGLHKPARWVLHLYILLTRSRQ